MQLDDFTKSLVEGDAGLKGLYKELLRYNLETQILSAKKNIEAIKLAGKKERKPRSLGVEQF